ncbi:MAG: class I SAM-dependent methyltransferase [Rhodospirillales bacterium]|nr:MAG: class I SAM-dependent methyltransferase [Rhodospirillales bacterium]
MTSPGKRFRGLRRMRMGLATVLGIRPQGFFIPYRYAGRRAPSQPAYPALERLLRREEAGFADLLAGIDDFAEELEGLGREPPPAPRWTQDWFPRLDAAALYTVVRRIRPATVVEVGAGHSTRFLARAIADGGFPSRVRVIDPAPRATLEGLAIELVKVPLEQAGAPAFAILSAGDILSIDSSHVLMPGTDVDVLLNRVVPDLPPGVLLHVHDVFLPDDYPAAWAWRGYNEQLGIAALIQGGGFRVLWSSHYVRSRLSSVLRDTVIARLPLLPGAHESSLWLEKS